MMHDDEAVRKCDWRAASARVFDSKGPIKSNAIALMRQTLWQTLASETRKVERILGEESCRQPQFWWGGE